MKMQGDYNLEEMVNHLLKANLDFRVERRDDCTVIVYKSLGTFFPVLVDRWLYFDRNGKQLHGIAPVADI